MIHVDLFSGIGGFALAAQWAGYETVMFCDNDSYCQAVLRKHWPGVPVIGDIREVNEETVADAVRQRYSELTRGTDCSEVGAVCEEKQGNGHGVWPEVGGCRGTSVADYQFPTIDLLTGGFPCQPFSVAGKRGGSNDDRFLWPQMLRVIAELRPRWVLGENVAGIINMALDDVLSDLEGEGYEVQAFVIPACAVNAPHRRDRVWIVAHATRREGDGRERGIMAGAERCGQGCDAAVDVGREDVADTNEQGPQGHGREHGLPARSGQGATCGRGECDAGDHWAAEPNVGRVAHGIPHRVDRLRGLGNAIVPQVAYQILKAIREVQ